MNPDGTVGGRHGPWIRMDECAIGGGRLGRVWQAMVEGIEVVDWTARIQAGQL